MDSLGLFIYSSKTLRLGLWSDPENEFYIGSKQLGRDSEVKVRRPLLAQSSICTLTYYWVSLCFPSWPLPCCVVETNLELTVFLLLQSERWCHWLAWAGLCGAEDQTQESCLLGKHSTQWATLPGQHKYCHATSDCLTRSLYIIKAGLDLAL